MAIERTSVENECEGQSLPMAIVIGRQMCFSLRRCHVQIALGHASQIDELSGSHTLRRVVAQGGGRKDAGDRVEAARDDGTRRGRGSRLAHLFGCRSKR